MEIHLTKVNYSVSGTFAKNIKTLTVAHSTWHHQIKMINRNIVFHEKIGFVRVPYPVFAKRAASPKPSVRMVAFPRDFLSPRALGERRS